MPRPWKLCILLISAFAFAQDQLPLGELERPSIERPSIEHPSLEHPSIVQPPIVHPSIEHPSNEQSTTCTIPTQFSYQPTEKKETLTHNSSCGVSLNIWTQNGTRNTTGPYLSGLLFEDIAHSGDGGLYAELIRNRAFQGSGVTIGREAGQQLPGVIIKDSENPTLPFAPVLDGWYPIGDARLSLDLLHPLADALQVALQVDVPLNATGEVGFKNDGWWGMHVSPQVYNASFFVQTSSFRWNATVTHFDVSLRDNATDEVFAQSTVALEKEDRPVPWMYRNYTTQLVPDVTAPSINNAFAITMDAEEARGQTFYFDLISLFPETYKNRPNGLRNDLAEKLEAGAFRFLRFPGGNNLEGYSIARRWKWWETIGPLIDRPGRPGDWSYFNTDGLGLMEYMYWCEDTNLVPVLGIYAGFSLDVANYDSGNSTDTNELPLELMGPILQEALDELEFLTGCASTYWGGKRAEYGHLEPFDVPFVEIGNEDFFSHDYPARAKFMLQGLREKYPDITYVYSSANSGNFNLTLPPGVIWDSHMYASRQFFINHFSEFDNWQSSHPGAFASVMEYHVNSIGIKAAVAEAVYALGWERNPNTVKLACFAPLMQNAHVWRHTPYLLLFDADPENTVISPSYYQEQMFNLHHGTETLPVTVGRGEIGPLFWQASIEGEEKVFVKVVNAGDEGRVLGVRLDVGFESVNGTTMHAGTVEDGGREGVVVPRVIEGINGEGVLRGRRYGKFEWVVPACSVNVLQFYLEEYDRGHLRKDEQEEL